MLSVIVVSFNTRDLLRKCLASLAAHEPGAQVVVVDNASRDGSADMVRAEFPSATLIELAENAGFAGANNAGLAAADRPFVALFNSDAEVVDDSLSRCVRRLQAEPTLGAVHPRLIGPDGKPQQCRYRFPTLAGVALEAARLAPRGESRSANDWLAGTALVVRREALVAAGGGLDAGYFMYWEDCDFSARLVRAGWGLAVEESAAVKHFGGASGGGPAAARRADLYAWYLYGKHRWFRRNRPAWEAAFLWVLDAVEVPRKLLRGLRYAGRRPTEWSHARVAARVLALGLLGLKPARP